MPITYAAVLIALLSPALAQERYPFNERPASVKIDITNSRKKYDGSFTLSGTARVCGELPAMLNFAGVPAFTVQFYPDPATGKESVTDVTFGSTELVGKVTTAAKFDLSVTVQSPAIGKPPAYVLNTTGPRKGSGTATLTTTPKGDTTLRVVGGNDMGESIDMSLTCGPRK
jgi:hypothetical protein